MKCPPVEESDQGARRSRQARGDGRRPLLDQRPLLSFFLILKAYLLGKKKANKICFFRRCTTLFYFGGLRLVSCQVCLQLLLYPKVTYRQNYMHYPHPVYTDNPGTRTVVRSAKDLKQVLLSFYLLSAHEKI